MCVFAASQVEESDFSGEEDEDAFEEEDEEAITPIKPAKKQKL